MMRSDRKQRWVTAAVLAAAALLIVLGRELVRQARDPEAILKRMLPQEERAVALYDETREALGYLAAAWEALPEKDEGLLYHYVVNGDDAINTPDIPAKLRTPLRMMERLSEERCAVTVTSEGVHVSVYSRATRNRWESTYLFYGARDDGDPLWPERQRTTPLEDGWEVHRACNIYF